MKNFVMALVAGLGAFVAIGLLSFFDAAMSDVTLLMAPFGATAVLVFGVPDSPLAQAKNVIFGHMITAIVGIVFAQYVGVTPLTLALATGVAVSAMLLSKTTHPPAGANPLLIMLSGQGWSFLFTPVLLGATLIVLVGKGMQMLLKWRAKSRVPATA
ncbi:HPP family protein [Vibrio navarrensis]|uniref:HPP family protein n=1 Tax=Vibrio navarrensis TaxID=29495 RepID=A0AAJ4IFC1_9VIBR|nr:MULTISPECIES: HPP family protein [Vibrio]KJR28891.1 HPP family protein [Vibrio sp. S234-5]MBE3651816.1 HPP family protein [Vibrio navarrensis]MBE3655979.1 HPP family protein [Vibrio navarrensis]MBE3660374.1 HPP family protein [Vibrio navarrensis]MBE4602637.1 HPP family protein [Vibrio navarrensis]